MDIDNLQQIRWACRRGMRELDLILLPFFDDAYQALRSDDKERFIALLKETDPDLLNWLMGYADAPAQFSAIISIIRQHVQNKM